VATAGPGCRTEVEPTALPEGFDEASGVAVSLLHPGVFWTHGDAGRVLLAVDRAGAEVGRYRLDEGLRDWEDIAVSPCGSGGGSCLYLGDLGDNYEERPAGAIYRVPEPDPAGSGDLPVERFPVRLPEGPRDIEALLVLPGERVLAVTKGRNHAVTVYRYPGPLGPDTVTLQEVQRLTEGPRILPRQVTGGAVHPGGRLAVLRTYESLRFYVVDADTLASMDGGIVNLRTLREAQGEGVGLGPDGLVALTSEAGPGGRRSSIALLRCSMEGI